MKLAGKIALVTGAARGIGRAIALRLAEDGAAVAIHYRTSGALAESAESAIRSRGGSARVVQGDVSAARDVESIVAGVQRNLGPIDILVNNAVCFQPGNLADLNDPDMESMWRTNVGGPVHLIRLVAEGMKGRKFGRIINITSAAAFGTAVEGTTFYAATKAALVILTRRFAMELGPHGITVNAVSPGFVPTEQSMLGKAGDEARERIEQFAGRAMVRRVGTPEDIAHATAFLASPAASFITAQVVSVDGGRLDYIGHS